MTNYYYNAVRNDSTVDISPRLQDYVQLTKSILWRDNPFPYLICFLWQEGVWEPDVPLGVCPLRLVHLSSWTWVLSFCSLYSPFFWCFGLFMIGRVLSPFLIWYVSCKRRGFGNLVLPLWFALLGGSFVFLDVSPFILFFVFFLFWVLWFIFNC